MLAEKNEENNRISLLEKMRQFLATLGQEIVGVFFDLHIDRKPLKADVADTSPIPYCLV